MSEIVLLDIVKSPLFRNSFLRVKLKENRELEGTDNPCEMAFGIPRIFLGIPRKS